LAKVKRKERRSLILSGELCSAVLNISKAKQGVRNDFYQTPTTVIVSFYLKKIDKAKAKVEFSSPTSLDLDLPTSDNKRYVQTIPLFAPIDQKASQFKIMGTKLELTLAKADGSSWPVLRGDEVGTGEIIQVGRAGRA
jgi:CS domain